MLEALTRLVDLGGPVVVALLLLSVVGAAAIIHKLLQLRPYGVRYFERLASQVAGSSTELAADGAIAELVAFALAERAADRPAAALEAEVARRGNLLLSGLSRHLRLVELIAYISPLLGLLGTVLGMIDAFRGLEVDVGQADAGVLAGGIWEALLTTAVGLGVAIPMTAAHSLLEGRAQRIGEQLQDLLERALSA